MATLIITSGPAEGQLFALGEHNVIMVGRDHDCTFQILDQRLSRRHMQIKRNSHGDGHVARDCDSTNGVQINGDKLAAESALNDGDEIQIGETCIVYTVKDAEEAASFHDVMRKRGEHRQSTLLRQNDEEL